MRLETERYRGAGLPPYMVWRCEFKWSEKGQYGECSECGSDGPPAMTAAGMTVAEVEMEVLNQLADLYAELGSFLRSKGKL